MDILSTGFRICTFDNSTKYTLLILSHLIHVTVFIIVRSVIEPEHDGQTNGQGGGPAEEDDDLGGGGVVAVLTVEDGRGHRKVSVKRFNNLLLE